VQAQDISPICEDHIRCRIFQGKCNASSFSNHQL